MEYIHINLIGFSLRHAYQTYEVFFPYAIKLGPYWENYAH